MARLTSTLIAILLIFSSANAFTNGYAEDDSYEYLLFDDGRTSILQCFNLSDSIITIPSTVEVDDTDVYTIIEVCNQAFRDNPVIKTLILPASIQYVTNVSYNDKHTFMSFEVDSENPYLCAVDGILYNKDKTVLVEWPKGRLGRPSDVLPSVVEYGPYCFAGYDFYGNNYCIEIPEGVTKIGDSAFSKAFAYSIKLPSTVKSIGAMAFYYCCFITNLILPADLEEIGINAFNHMIYLSDIYISSKNTNYSVYGRRIVVDNRTGQVVLAAPNNRGTVNLPQGVRSIGYAAFQNAEIIGVNMPESVEYIETNAFSSCMNLKNVSLSSSLTELPINCFDGCKSLDSIALPTSIKVLRERCLRNTAIRSIDLSNIREIEISALSQTPNLTAIDVPEGITDIQCFAGGGLKNLSLPSTTKCIDSNFLQFVPALTTIQCKAIEPPSVTNGAREEDFNLNEITDEQIRLVVPRDSKDKYANATGWRQFCNIEESDINSISDIFADGTTIETGSCFVHINSADNRITLFDISGRIIASATGTLHTDGLKPAVYVARIGARNVKIIVR